MSGDNKRSGGCLCGVVRYEVTILKPEVHVCHCTICQKWGGGPALAITCEKGWKITGEENLTWYDSSESAQRGFCSKCGSHLFFQLKDGDYRGLCAGNLDTQEGLKIGEHIFIDKKPSYYDFTDKSERLTEEEFMAQFTEVDKTI